MSEPRTYPLPRPVDDDPRFTYGLLLEVVQVIERHGYPSVCGARDLVELQLVLFRFLYAPLTDAELADAELREAAAGQLRLQEARARLLESKEPAK